MKKILSLLLLLALALGLAPAAFAAENAGFSDVRWDRHGKKPWICVLARK